jgi:hypothetical protein
MGWKPCYRTAILLDDHYLCLGPRRKSTTEEQPEQ